MMDDGRTWRAGYRAPRAARPALRAADAVVAARRGGAARARFPETTIVLNHTGLPVDRAQLPGWARAWRACCVPERRGEDLRPRATVDAQPRDRARRRSSCSASSAACSRATSRSTACARPSTRSIPASARSRRQFSDAERARALSRQRVAHLQHGGTHETIPARLCRRRPDGPADDQASARLGYECARSTSSRALDAAARGRRRRCAGADLVLLNLPTTEAVEEAVFARAAGRCCARRNCVVDFSTIKVDACRSYAARLRARDRLRLGRRAGVRRAAGRRARHADRHGGRRTAGSRAARAAHGRRRRALHAHGAGRQRAWSRRCSTSSSSAAATP